MQLVEQRLGLFQVERIHDVHDGGLTLPSKHDRPNEKGCPAQVLSVSGHMTPTQRGNLIIGRLNLTADNELKAGACWQYLRGNAYERQIRLALFQLDIDRVLILIFGHLAQELLELAAAFLAHTAFKLG